MSWVQGQPCFLEALELRTVLVLWGDEREGYGLGHKHLSGVNGLVTRLLLLLESVRTIKT